MLPIISYKYHVINEEAHRKIKAAIVEYDEILTLVKFFWFSKDDPTGHSERKRKLTQKKRGKTI